MFFMVVLAALSFWENSIELANRLFIILTIVLTLASCSAERPYTIEKAPYQMFHDSCKQQGLVFVFLIAIQNVFICTMCTNCCPEAPMVLLGNSTLFAPELYWVCDWCEVDDWSMFSWFGTKKMDGAFLCFIFLAGVVVFIFDVMFVMKN